jgi:LysM repeat protein
LAVQARAIDPSEVIVTGYGAYARALSPDRYNRDTQGSAFVGILERALNERYSVGIQVQQVSLRDGFANNFSYNSLDLIGRAWLGHYKFFNPYLKLGLGGNLFRDSLKNPFGDVLHVEAGFGSTYVFNSHWALDYGVSYHGVAPLDVPYTYATGQLGLSYRYGTQPKVNEIAPSEVFATAIDSLDEIALDKVMGRVRVKNVEYRTIQYTVRPGDSLYMIARRNSKLGDAELWPVLYEINREQIHDADVIEPGMVLIIPRQISAEQAAKAKLMAQEKDKNGKRKKKKKPAASSSNESSSDTPKAVAAP